jgi:hypothetical protein
MSPRRPPALPDWLLDRSAFARQNPPLSGDLLEEFRSGRSAAWYWRQALAVIVTGLVRNARVNRRALMVSTVGSVAEICYWLALWWFLRPPQPHPSAERISVFLVGMLVAALVLLARDNPSDQYQRAMLAIVACAWFIGFLMTYWLITRFCSTFLAAFVSLQALGLLRAVEQALKPPDPVRTWAKAFTALKEFLDCFR